MSKLRCRFNLFVFFIVDYKKTGQSNHLFLLCIKQKHVAVKPPTIGALERWRTGALEQFPSAPMPQCPKAPLPQGNCNILLPNTHLFLLKGAGSFCP